MYRAEIATPWTGTGTGDDANRPLVADAYPLQSWVDVTGQAVERIRPSPNLYVIEVEADEATLEAIGADGRFWILWEDGRAPERGRPGGEEWDGLRGYLLRAGVKGVDVDAALSAGPAATRGQSAAALRGWLRQRPKETRASRAVCGARRAARRMTEAVSRAGGLIRVKASRLWLTIRARMRRKGGGNANG
jgi:hypothetical protein